MLRITEASYANNSLVNLHLRRSKVAHLIQISILISMIWAVLLSTLPTVVSLYLMAPIVRLIVVGDFSSNTGRLEIHSSGDLKLNNYRSRCRSVFTLYKPFMVQITTLEGTKINIWRDACIEKDYRQFLVMLRSIIAKKRE